MRGKSFLQLLRAHFLNRRLFLGIFFLILFPCLTHISRRLLALGKNAKFCSEACKGLGPRPAGCAAQRTPLSGHLDPGRRHWVPLLVSRTGGVSLLDDLQGKCLWGRHGGSQQSPHPGTTAGGGGGCCLFNAVPFPTSHFPDGQAPRKRRSARPRTALGRGPEGPVTRSTARHGPGAAEGPPGSARHPDSRGKRRNPLMPGPPASHFANAEPRSPCVSIKPRPPCGERTGQEVHVYTPDPGCPRGRTWLPDTGRATGRCLRPAH